MKKILFVIESLSCGGAEKSCVTLLNLLDYHKYEVSLQLFSRGGEFEEFLPHEVHILDEINIKKFLNKSIFSRIKYSFFHKKYALLFASMKFSLLIRLKKLSHASLARIWWESFSPFISQSQHYDIAIAYAQAVPTFYVSQKVKAPLKISWVNAMYKLTGRERTYQRSLYEKIHKIVCVTPDVKNAFKDVYSDYANKMYVVKDIVDSAYISKLANQSFPYRDEKKEGRKIIVTVGRLNKYTKGYDIALQVCNILKEREIEFCWYVVGDGNYREEMETYISEHQLKGYFILVGAKVNPYPYMKNADIYVQTSRSEGYGLTIAEARLLNKPIVTTEYDSVYHQMIHGKNGLVTSFEPSDIADAIELLLQNRELYDSIVEYQKAEKKGNTEELEKFYALINS